MEMTEEADGLCVFDILPAVLLNDVVSLIVECPSPFWCDEHISAAAVCLFAFDSALSQRNSLVYLPPFLCDLFCCKLLYTFFIFLRKLKFMRKHLVEVTDYAYLPPLSVIKR